MQIRNYTPADLDQLFAIYRTQGFDYPFPDLDDPIFISKLVLEDGGRIEQAIALRLTAEAYLLLDHGAGTAAERWEKFRGLHRAAENEALAKGLDDVHCWLPPGLKRFSRRLQELGWVRDDRYTPYCKYLAPEPEPRVAL